MTILPQQTSVLTKRRINAKIYMVILWISPTNNLTSEKIMDFSKSIKDIEKKIGYAFRDKSLLKQAFTRSSFSNEKNYRGRESYSSNEILEFFGDSVLSTAIITLLMRSKTQRYEHGVRTELTEGDMSNIRSKLSDKRNLSKSTKSLGLQKYLLLGEGDEKLGISEEASVMEDLFESIIGAVYIDSNMNLETVISVVSGILDVSVYSNGEATIQSYKNALQEWCADKKRRLPPPVYRTVSESGPDHRKTYERGCYIGDRLVATGSGKNQKIADAQAAEAAIKALMAEEAKTSGDKMRKMSEGAAQSLRAYAAKNKLPSPEYHDLGECPESTMQSPIYKVECCFMGKSTTATGRSKQEARDMASLNMLSEIGGAEQSASTKSKKEKPSSATSAGPKKPNQRDKRNSAPKTVASKGQSRSSKVANVNPKSKSGSESTRANPLPKARKPKRKSNV